MMHFRQAGERYELMSKKEKEHLIDNIVESLMFVDEAAQKKVVEHLKKANAEMGGIIEKALYF